MQKFYNRIKNRIGRGAKSSEPSGYREVERAEYLFYLNYLREDMTVFDVGANAGELTLLFSRFAACGSVHAFEASRAAFEQLETVCRATRRHSVNLNHLAMAEKSGSVRLYVYDDDYLSFNTQAARPLKNYGLDIEPVGVEEVRATTVDEYCSERKIERIDLLKIDVEGAELQILRGARQMLESKLVSCIVFEFGQTTYDMGNSPEEIEEFLESMNYKIRNLIKGEPIFPGRGNVASAKFSMHLAEPK